MKDLNLERDIAPGRLAKTPPLSCNSPRCIFCHYEKVLELPTREEIVAAIREFEQRKEMTEDADTPDS